MKYTIEGFNQQTLIDYGLNATDAVILRYIVDFWHSERMVKIIHDNKEFLWINYKAVIEALPCIEINSKIALSRRFKKYIDCGLMEHHTHKIGGTFSCYRFTEKYTPLTQKYEGFKLESQTPFNSKVKPKDSSINDSSIKEYKETATRVLLYLNEKAKRNFKATYNNNRKHPTGSLVYIIARLKEGYTEEQCKRVVDVKVSHWLNDTEMDKHLNYTTLFRPLKFPLYLEQKKLVWYCDKDFKDKDKWIKINEDDPRNQGE